MVSVSPGAIGGFGANHHLRQSLVFLDMPMLQQPEAYIGGAGDLFDEAGKLTDDETREFLEKFIDGVRGLDRADRQAGGLTPRRLRRVAMSSPATSSPAPSVRTTSSLATSSLATSSNRGLFAGAFFTATRCAGRVFAGAFVAGARFAAASSLLPSSSPPSS